ncbi:MAG TPA: alpha-amylase C-terminal beta-sheet domain-containing protein [Edaphobacter sp.]|nr:alpha-amylase C-terminal beta-sheet domain-containing protein [Edaphobacter sp.]
MRNKALDVSVRILFLFLILLGYGFAAWAQSGFDDNRVMLQGFYFESYRFGHPQKFPTYGTKPWYQILRENADAIAAANFDLVWMPPPSYAGEYSAGYNPKRYFVLDNSYGSRKLQRMALMALLNDGVEPIADIVINHRDGLNGWADFKDPAWGPWAICADDEAFSAPESGIENTPVEQRGKCEETVSYRSEGTYAYPSFRDLAHTDIRVRRDIVRYLLALRSLGYRGWRYDMVHGYGAQWIALYNQTTKPTFSVGEYDWTQQAEERGWIWATATDGLPTGADHLKTSSDVFDFETQFSLKSIDAGNYTSLYGFGDGIGLVGDTTDGMPWKQRAVIFVENHDTGYRTNEDGTPQQDHQTDSFANNWQVEQAYAFVLTHPGIPCVYWKHYFDWGQDLHNKIKALINARKAAGVNSGSSVDMQENARQKGIYAARIHGTHGDLYVRIGGSDQQWSPSDSGYSDYRTYAQGAGWTVWVALPGNPPLVAVPHHSAFPVPIYKKADQQIAPF